MAKIVTVEIEAKTGKAIDKIDDLEQGIKGLNEELADTGKGLEGVDDGAKTASKGIKGVGVALKAAGVGLVIAALAKLKEIFEQNQSVADTFATAFETVSLIFNDFVNFVINNSGVVVDFFTSIFQDPLGSIEKLGDLIKNNIIERFNSLLDTLGLAGKAVLQFFDGDFAGAAETAKEAGKEFVDVLTGVDGTVDKVGEGINKATEATKKYVTQTITAAATNVQLSKSAEIARVKQQGLIETYDRQAEKLRQIRDDDTKSIEERIKANDELGAVLDEQTQAMLDQVDIQIAAAQAQYDKNQSQENYIALLEAQQEKEAVLAQIEGFRSEQISNRIALEKEQKDLEDETEEERIEKEEERLQKEAEIEQQRINNKAAAADAIAGILGSETAAGKAALVAKQLIAGQEMIQNAKTALQKIAVDTAGAGASTATGFAQTLKAGFPQNVPLLIAYAAQAVGIGASIKQAVSKAKSGLGPEAGGVNIPSITTPSAPAVATPQAPAFNIVGASETNQLAEAIGGQQQQPVKAFVVSNDISTAQELDRNIVQGASIG
jgi:hypothetical protein